MGYTVNNQEYLAIKLGAKSVIGDHSVMFKKRSEFLYKALRIMDCYAIRKNKFYEIQDKYNEFGTKMKIKIFNQYKHSIRKPVLEQKQETYD